MVTYFAKIMQFVESLSLTIEEKVDDNGYRIFLVSSDAGGDLRVLHSLRGWAITVYKQALIEQLKKDAIAGKQMPF